MTMAAVLHTSPTIRSNGVLSVGMGWFEEEPGGLNRMYAGLLTALTAAGARVQGIVAGDPGAAASAPRNVRFFARRDASFLARMSACRRLVRTLLASSGSDIVAAHFAPYAAPFLDLVRDVPFVFHFHGPWAAESRSERQRGVGVAVKRGMETAVYRRADRLIVLSEAFAQILCRDFGVARDKISIVPGGVDADRFATPLSRREARESLGLPADRPVVGVVRRLVHRMGLEGLIEAMILVRERVPEALLVVAGTGPLAEPLAARVVEIGLERNVRFLGFVGDEHLPDLYRACDVTIVPSLALEGFGLTTIESLAAGTPVMVTPIGGLPETVRDLDAELVLEDSKPATLGRALSEALRGARRLPTAQRCAEYARQSFDWPVIAAKVQAIYG